MDFAWHLLSFVVAIGVLVTVHEYGHFWVARRLGVKVLRFSIGFGKPLVMWRRGRDQTEYVIAAIPLGGFVRMLDEREGDVSEVDLPRAFNRQSLLVRTAVVLAGPLFNFIFAVFAYWLMFVLGVSGARPWIGDVVPGSLAELSGLRSDTEIVAVDGRASPTWEAAIQSIIGTSLDGPRIPMTVRAENGRRTDVTLDMGSVVVDDLTQGHFFSVLGFEPLRPKFSPILGEIEPGGPAAMAGLRPGDKVVSANDDAIPGWSEWVKYVRKRPSEALEMRIERGKEIVELTLTPVRIEEGELVYGRIGAGVAPLQGELDRYYTTVRYGMVDSVEKAFARTYETTALTLRMFWKMVTLEISLENLSGPISIAQYAGYTAKIGPSKFIEFLAIVSISLGILNLLPIPVLDGGHLMYYFIELFKGGPVSEEAQFFGQRLGIAMLFGLMGLAFYNDLTRFFG
jgi:regulator of sigma E protease